MVDIRLKVQNYFGYAIDPIQTNRKRAPFMGASPATTKDWGVLTLPPQLMHMDFDPDGLVREFGFYVVNRRQGNTGELGCQDSCGNFTYGSFSLFLFIG
jgi:hypothetical protein